MLSNPEPGFKQQIDDLSKETTDSTTEDLSSTVDTDAVALSKALETDTMLKHRRAIQNLIEQQTGSPDGVPEDVRHAYVQEVSSKTLHSAIYYKLC